VERFEWTGTPDDEATCHWRGMVARAARIGPQLYWWAVRREGALIGDAVGRGVYPHTGDGARWVCEMVMRLAYLDRTEQTSKDKGDL
jgi:hypothetical protein